MYESHPNGITNVCTYHPGPLTEKTTTLTCGINNRPMGAVGRYLIVQLADRNSLTLCEVEVYTNDC